MSSIRKCTKCGQRISLRKMPHGKWVAFDASTQIAHKCYKKNNPETKIKDLVKDNSIKKTADESISIKYDDEPTPIKATEYVEEIIEQPKKVKADIKENINLIDDKQNTITAEELIKDYKPENIVREERYIPASQSSGGADFFKFILYAGGFFLVIFLLAKAPGAIVGLIFLIFFMVFIFKR